MTSKGMREETEIFDPVGLVLSLNFEEAVKDRITLYKAIGIPDPEDQAVWDLLNEQNIVLGEDPSGEY